MDSEAPDPVVNLGDDAVFGRDPAGSVTHGTLI